MRQITENLENKVLNYPILQHFQKGEIVLTPEGQQPLKPVGKFILILLSLLVFGAVGYLVWNYILPPVMRMLGQFVAIALTGLAAVLLFVMLPVILKAFRRFARKSEQALIREDPFGELLEQKDKMLVNRKKFKESKVKIKSLRMTMENEATKSEADCKNFQEQILALNTQSRKIKEIMDAMIAANGQKAADTDEYVEHENNLTVKLSNAQRISHQLEQSKLFVRKYGSRANVMAKLDRNLTKAETAMDIKIADFDVTISMLQKDYEFARNSKNATDAAKNAMLFTQDWELDYAMDVVKSTISLDLAKTSENLMDIDTLTSTYSLDNDELYTNLDKLASKISGGQDTIPSASKITNVNYKLTTEDKQASGGFGDIF